MAVAVVVMVVVVWTQQKLLLIKLKLEDNYPRFACQTVN